MATPDEIIIGFPPVPWALEQIAKMDEPHYVTLLDAVSTKEAFDKDLKRCEKLATKLNAGMEPRHVLNLLASLQFLYERLRESEQHKPNSLTALSDFLEITGLRRHLDGDTGDKAFNRLLRLLAKNEDLERQKRIQWLKTGILERATDFASFVDLRPRFSEDRGKVEEIIPVVILRITTNTEGTEQSYAFQLTIESLAKMREVLDDVEKKVSAVRADAHLGIRLYDVADEEG